MAKKLWSVLVAAIVMISSFSGVCVSADTLPEISIAKAEQLEDKSIYLSGKIVNPVDNQEITITAYKLENGVYNEKNSIYVDQQNSIINADGTFSVTFNPKVSLDADSEYAVKVGGTAIADSIEMKIKTREDGNAEIQWFGDSDGDGIITVDDASLALQYVLNPKLVDRKYLDDKNFIKRMDVTGEKVITASQVSAILRKALAGDSFAFVVGETFSSGEESTEEKTTEKQTGEQTTEEQTTEKQTENTTQGGSSGDDDTETTTEVIVEADILVDGSLDESVPSENKYKTIREAIDAVPNTDKSTESDRVVIDIVPGVYREQVVVKKPYITLRKKPGMEGEVKSTWYYGQGSMYDSANDEGFYDPSVIGDGKVNKPKNWGAAFTVDGKATGIVVRDITFENSYNQYYTKEELADGLTVDPSTDNSMFDRAGWIREQIENRKDDAYINKWITSRANMNYNGVTSSPRERAAAFYCSGDKFEAYNCKFISKQDTMGINSKREYYENCILAGTVDYICGSATAVFNNCTLLYDGGADMSQDSQCVDDKKKGYTDGGYITAPANGVGQKGYLFYKCRITGNDTATPGTFGRPWGQPGGPEAIYYKTTIENSKSTGELLISPVGWDDMSRCKKDEARFFEYGSVDSSGKAIDVSKRVRNKVAPMGTVLNEWQVLEFNPYNYTKGSDGWDPMNMSGKYAEFTDILNSIKFDSNVTGDITLPEPPAGYEYYWESDTEYAVVNSNQKTVSVIRPAYGQKPINAVLTVYIRKTGTEYGVKEDVKLTITPHQTTDNTFTVNGKVTLGMAADKNVEVKVDFVQKNAVISSNTVTIESGKTEQEYAAKYLPVGEYNVKIYAVTSGYKVTEPTSGEVTVSGNSGETKTLNTEVKELIEVTISTADFTENWAAAPAATLADENCTAKVVTGGNGMTANVGDGNKAMKFTKKEGAMVKKEAGFYFDLAKAVKDSGGTLLNTDTLQFSMDLLLEKDKAADSNDTNGYMASDYSLFDFTTKLSAEDKANQGRYVRYGIYKSWNQLNFFTATNARINGDNTQFDKNSTMRNKWYHIVTDVDLKAKTISTTVYDKEKNEIINKVPFVIAAPNVDGENANYPAELDLNSLYFAIYMDKKANTENRIEFYVDNLELKYKDFK